MFPCFRSWSCSRGTLLIYRRGDGGFAQKAAKITKVSELPFRVSSSVWSVRRHRSSCRQFTLSLRSLPRHPSQFSLYGLCDLLCMFPLFPQSELLQRYVAHLQKRRRRIRTEGRKDHKGFGVAFSCLELSLERVPASQCTVSMRSLQGIQVSFSLCGLCDLLFKFLSAPFGGGVCSEAHLTGSLSGCSKGVPPASKGVLYG
jgi:hypothetical protein